MSHSRISPDLGRLPGISSLKYGKPKTENLRQVLKSLAIKSQREQPLVFYSLREVSTQFRVPVSTVAKIYQDLEQEGFLSRVRGSKTILNGLRNNRRLSVRGLIGLPALISHFIGIQDYRTCLICMRRELRLRGFASTLLFFRREDAVDGTLSDQLKNSEVDTVIWLQPGRSAKGTLLRLSDMGVPVIGISSVGTPSMPSRYFVWRERAIETLLRDWKDRSSARKITLIDSKAYRSPVTEEVLRVVLENLQIEAVIKSFQGENSVGFLNDLCRIQTDGIVFASSGLASMFGFRNPEGLTNLFEAQRVALIDGPIDMPFAKIPHAPVDLVIVNWQALAESIVNDLITREAFDRNRFTTFEGEARLRVRFSEFADELHPSQGIAESF